jgi:hypothetical protein
LSFAGGSRSIEEAIKHQLRRLWQNRLFQVDGPQCQRLLMIC